MNYKLTLTLMIMT